MGATNYGSLLEFDGAPVGDCMVVDFPEVTVSNIDGTSHQSGGVEVRFPGGLQRTTEFTVTLVVASGVLEDIQGHLVAKDVENVTLTCGGVVEFSFDGFYTGFKPEPADVGSEDIVKASVTIQSTGAITITSL